MFVKVHKKNFSAVSFSLRIFIAFFLTSNGMKYFIFFFCFLSTGGFLFLTMKAARVGKNELKLNEN